MTHIQSNLLRSFILLLTLSFAYCKYAQKTPAETTGQPTTTIMPEPSATPTGDYVPEWKTIDSLERQGLFKSALERTEALYARAKADRNGAQTIKTLLFRGKYTTMLQEDGFVQAVQILENEEKTARNPERAVLQSLLGELYRTYLQNQGWDIQDRTPVPDGEGGDILTWSAEQIERRARQFYLASVADEPALRAITVDYLRDISQPGHADSVGREALRPTLFDLLGHRALTYFSDESSFLTEPAYKFYLDQPQAFDPAPDFVRFRFESRDTTSGKWLAVQLFQRLIAAHQPEGQEAALIDADLLRLEFVKNNSVLEDKDERYRQALAILHKTHYNHPSDAEIVYQLAQAWIEQDSRQPESNRELLRQAVTECEDAIRRHPGSFGAQQCAALLFDLRQPSLDLNVEYVGLPQKPLLVSVAYKNLSRIWTKVVQVPNDPDVFGQVEWDQRLNFLNGLPAIQQRSWTLIDPGDYHQHRTEIKVDPLPAGRYFVLVSASETFDADGFPVSFAPMVCSRLAGISISYDGDSRFAIVDRETGAPQAGVQGDCFEMRWNQNERRNQRNLIKQIRSDREGIMIPQIDTRRSFSIRLSQNGDTLWLGEHYRGYRGEPGERPREVQFFTDRSLYRPGQTVYFKGIVLQRNQKDYPRIVPNTSVTVHFYDANYQEKGTLNLKTNEYGTFNGAFAAPVGGLTGRMSIRAEELDGAAWFNVEEYKRPKFEVSFKPVEGAYRVNDTITVRGEAKNYAGSSVDGAQLRYRVVRETRFPWWDWWSWRRPVYSETMEIANGVATTGADGSFEIAFQALPDRTIPKKDQPLFDYRVSVDVTDITGETRSNQTQVSAGYVALDVDFNLPPEIELDSLRKVGIQTANTAGQFQAAAGTIEVQALQKPAQVFVKRYWGDPDKPVLPEADFRRDFPEYAWNGEDKPDKWPKSGEARSVGFNTATDKAVNLYTGAMRNGYYQIVLKTEDPFGEAIEIKRIVRVWSANDPSSRFESPAAKLEKSSCEPGETARIWVGGAADRLFFLFAHDRQGAPLPLRWLDVRGAVPVELPVQESDRGGINATGFAVKNNRYYSLGSMTVYVPWSNKDLNISYETFRDKLAPGDKEEWRIRISGPKKERVAAELVAALYDASLDQFLPHNWAGIRFPRNFPKVNFGDNGFSLANGDNRFERKPGIPQPDYRSYRTLNWFGFPLYGGSNLYYMDGVRMGVDTILTFDPETYEEQVQIVRNDGVPHAAPAMAKMANGDAAARMSADEAAPEEPVAVAPAGEVPPPSPRRNLNETVFFFPELHTDAEGNVVLKFTMNEALTRWKLLAFAHTKELEWAVSEKTVVTQKELMILTNPPRFLREGDQIEFSAKVSNLSDQPVSGTASLKLFDAATMQPADQAFGLTEALQTVRFTVPAGQSAPLYWRLSVPEGKVDGLTWQVFAEGEPRPGGPVFRDGEENTLPVLTNRMLVTETLPIAVRGNQSKSLVFDNLKNSRSSTLRTHRYTLEFSSNPAWYAVQSLPYLMEFPHECYEQLFSRFYANTLASSVTQKLPSLRRVYDRWKVTGSDALKSNLSKNQELKTALLEETPWVLEAQSEEQQKQNIALLFDLNRMADEQERVLDRLKEGQSGNGGWPWFPGGRESWYITQHIVAGFGHLDKLGAFPAQNDPRTDNMIKNALGFCEREVQQRYRDLEREVQKGLTTWEADHLDGMIIHYLYARSFYPIGTVDKITAYYLGQGEQYWLKRGLYEQGMLALALKRFNRPASAEKIVASLRERALVKEELGMYWPFDWGMYWYQLPVETQALMVEVFDEVASDPKAVEELRIWLLKNKQTNRWESTKATAEAVYALLLHGDNWLLNNKPVLVKMGGKTLQPAEYEPGTGYFKESWSGAEVKPSWAEIKVENPNSNIVWGAAYWQYFEDLDKIQSFKKTPLTIVKQVYKEENTDTGPKLTALNEGNTLHPGDKLKVRIEIRVDRAMEFVHLKDMRASGFEPVNVLSGYRWQGGLGYYESTRDLATHFFIDYLPRGTFVLEYPMVVNHRGDFSNGITTLQCMYAPEFTSHSEGIRLKVGE